MSLRYHYLRERHNTSNDCSVLYVRPYQTNVPSTPSKASSFNLSKRTGFARHCRSMFVGLHHPTNDNNNRTPLLDQRSQIRPQNNFVTVVSGLVCLSALLLLSLSLSLARFLFLQFGPILSPSSPLKLYQKMKSFCRIAFVALCLGVSPTASTVSVSEEQKPSSTINEPKLRGGGLYSRDLKKNDNKDDKNGNNGVDDRTGDGNGPIQSKRCKRWSTLSDAPSYANGPSQRAKIWGDCSACPTITDSGCCRFHTAKGTCDFDNDFPHQQVSVTSVH